MVLRTVHDYLVLYQIYSTAGYTLTTGHHTPPPPSPVLLVILGRHAFDTSPLRPALLVINHVSVRKVTSRVHCG